MTLIFSEIDLMTTHVAPCDGFRERLGETHLESAK